MFIDPVDNFTIVNQRQTHQREISLRLALASARIATGDRQGALQEAMLAKTELALWPGWRRDRAEALIRRLAGAGGRWQPVS